MSEETRKDLILHIKEGSRRELRKLKKDDLIDFCEEVLDESEKISKKQLSEISDLKLAIESRDLTIQGYESKDSLLEESKELIKELREKYENSLDENNIYKTQVQKLLTQYKIMRVAFGIAIILLIIIIILNIL